MRSIKFCIALLCLLALLTACGRNRNASGDDAGANAGVSTSTIAYTGTQSLTILGPGNMEQMLQQAGTRLQEEMAFEGIILNFEVETYFFEDRDSRFAQLLSQFAAGHGPDLFVQDNSPLYSFIQNGFLADINYLIEQCLSFRREDYFTYVLDAFELNGKLYTFPLEFEFQYIGINASLPVEITSRFTALNTVTSTQLIQLYRDLRQYNTRFANMHLGVAMRPFSTQLQEQLIRYVDIAAQTVNLNTPSFTNFLEDLRYGYGERIRLGAGHNFTSPLQSEQNFALYSANYMFHSTTMPLDKFNAFFEFTNPYFIHFIPLSDEDGRLVNPPRRNNNIAISDTAYGPTALAFISHLVDVYSQTSAGWGNLSTPIKRSLFEEHTETGFRHVLSGPTLLVNVDGRMQQPEEPHNIPRFIGQGDYVQEMRQVSAAIARLYNYVNMPVSPMTISQTYIPPFVYIEPIQYMPNENIPISEVATRLERSISNWFNQEHEDIATYVPIEDLLAEREHFPVRTLSVLIMHTENFVYEAGQRMAEDWARRGYGYNFELEISTIDFRAFMPEDTGLWTLEAQFAALEQIRTRVGTMLMAGVGYDLICVDMLPSFWKQVETGLFADIYQLIEQCPRTSHEDFFIQAFTSFELDGGLYAFPLNLGFSYVGINENLPQAIIDRFRSQSTISVYDLMGLYLELQQYPEFNNLIFTSEGFNTFRPNIVFQNAICDFIDISNRRAYLTDNRFISFLEKYRQIFYWADTPHCQFPHNSRWSAERNRGSGNITPLSHIQRVGGQYAFWVEDIRFLPTQTTLEPIGSPFKYFIPITNMNGELLVSGYSSTFSITAQADGALAWEFMQHLIYMAVNPTPRAQYNGALINGIGRYTLNTSIARRYFEDQFTNNLLQAAVHNSVGEVPNPAHQIESALAKMSEYNEMQMVFEHNFVPIGLYWDILEQFLRGLLRPEELAQQLHNRISLWLIE